MFPRILQLCAWCFNPHVTFYPLGNCSLARIKGYANVPYKMLTLNGYNQIRKLICCDYISSISKCTYDVCIKTR